MPRVQESKAASPVASVPNERIHQPRHERREKDKTRSLVEEGLRSLENDRECLSRFPESYMGSPVYTP